jgi:hypothetical protein
MGKERASTSQPYINTVQSLIPQRRFQEAEEMLKQRIGAIAKSLGKAHSTYVDSLAILASIYGHMDRE